ncbi:UDP-glucose 4-epimerase GalE [Salinispora arenicola]|uniref:UDP-glucose 4-epimerase GalE n=1 Tax=Salinispora arenicola TaxID=168697 RepID=UPI0003728760|nr:UDP-glucose 4-epimerase GalE [Salinispora arenicola]
MKVLVAGGAGFIGSTVASALIDAGHRPIVLDSLVTGRREFCHGRDFYHGDIADGRLVDHILAEHPDISAAIHCAALIVVPDSVDRPIPYYRENVSKTLDFVDRLLANSVDRLLFSSSAAIYQPGDDLGVEETSPVNPTSPYAQTKIVVERMLADIAGSSALRVVSLRYFNPIGADPLLRTGPQMPMPSHVLGRLIEAHRTGRPFRVTGVDYPTRDGSGLRDYVHVWDLAGAHVRALERFDDLFRPGTSGHTAVNLGTGAGTTVLELVEAFNSLVSRPVRVEPAPRRPGDVPGSFSRSDQAEQLLGWRAQLDVRRGIVDSLAWFDRRPRVLPDLVESADAARRLAATFGR